MRYGSICSGIEAASCAWHPIGWKAAWLAEIEPFPSAVLAHHFPETPNLEDITAYDFLDRAQALGPIDVLIGGTPCQSFSVAGLRKGLNDDRGNLALRWCEIIMATRPAVAVWENVPGVLSDRGNAFGAILAGMVGADAAFVPPGGRWTSAGMADGPEGRLAWRVLDAQHFGVPQRRRRVFVVRCPRDGADPVEILFERQGLLRHPAAGRKARKDVAPALGDCSNGGGANGPGRTVDTVESLVVGSAFGGGRQAGELSVATSLTHHGNRQDFESETSVTHTLTGEGHDASEDETGRGRPLVFEARYARNGRGAPGDKAPPLKAENGGTGKGDGAPLIYDPNQITSKTNRTSNFESAPTLSQAQAPHVAQSTVEVADTLGVGDNQTTEFQSEVASVGMAVRRLTPRECERLQGFPDDWTLIPWRGKPAEDCPDGPRYRGIGNSMAVPVIRWIGERIASTENEA